jgi:antitoxin component of MazEF toxin-antitoxin module
MGRGSKARIGPGIVARVSLKDGRLLVTPIRRSRPALRDLLKFVTHRNLHGEMEWGVGEGREIW